MKSTKNSTPKHLLEDMEQDPTYKVCMLFGWHGHTCEGRLTKEHAIIISSKKVQTKEAIISLCAKGHDVDQFQDSHNMVKELNEWVAYSRMTDNDLLSLCGDSVGVDPNLSKARSHFQKKKYLIAKYGVWEQKAGYKASNDINGTTLFGAPRSNFTTQPLKDERKKMWYAVPEHLQGKVKTLIELYELKGEKIVPWQAIDLMIEAFDFVEEDIKQYQKAFNAYKPEEKVEIDWSLVGIKK